MNGYERYDALDCALRVLCECDDAILYSGNRNVLETLWRWHAYFVDRLRVCYVSTYGDNSSSYMINGRRVTLAHGERRVAERRIARRRRRGGGRRGARRTLKSVTAVVADVREEPGGAARNDDDEFAECTPTSEAADTEEAPPRTSEEARDRAYDDDFDEISLGDDGDEMDGDGGAHAGATTKERPESTVIDEDIIELDEAMIRLGKDNGYGSDCDDAAAIEETCDWNRL